METHELTHQLLHDYRHYKRLARTRARHMLLPLNIPPAALSLHLFSFLLFHLSVSFICVCPPLPQIKPTNLRLASLATLPSTFSPPLLFHAFFMMYFSPLAELCLLASWPFLFCQSPPTIAWQIADREADILSLRGLDQVKITFMWNYFSHLSKFLPCKYK